MAGDCENTEETQVKITINREKNTLTISDNGIGMNEQKIQQKKGNIAVLHLNPCDDLAKANQIMKENNCSEIIWVK